MLKFFNKDNIQKLKQAMHLNIFGIECPECCVSDGVSNPTLTAKVSLTRNSGVYIKCKSCKLTTPIFKDFNKAVECWDDYFVTKETDLLLGEINP